MVASSPNVEKEVNGVAGSCRRAGVKTIAAAAIALSATLLAGCGTSATPPPPDPAGSLAAHDTAGGQAAPAPVAGYQAALSKLAGRCKVDTTGDQAALVAGLAAEVDKGRSLMADKGVTESDWSVLQHVTQSIPAGSPKLKCAEVIGAYVTLRTG
jgi:hypothetical protein